jgi:hypothetical protein
MPLLVLLLGCNQNEEKIERYKSDLEIHCEITKFECSTQINGLTSKMAGSQDSLFINDLEVLLSIHKILESDPSMQIEPDLEKVKLWVVEGRKKLLEISTQEGLDYKMEAFNSDDPLLLKSRMIGECHYVLGRFLARRCYLFRG